MRAPLGHSILNGQTDSRGGGFAGSIYIDFQEWLYVDAYALFDRYGRCTAH
ncbi:hypothetical protein [Endozoicomonas elysicola]|uniref:hypothetical protein n=1 Tax=Endozoicomonas elysicola TaxID=305900 RepID=UPI001B7FA26D|nr:hypothetical protein [Endozoicomonas elysicola]